MAQGFEKKNILLVDSDKIQLEIAKSFLKGEYVIHAKKSKQEAINYIIDTKPQLDLIMVDTVSPNIIGIDFFNTIKRMSVLPVIPIAFLTSSEGIQKESAELVVPSISKPYGKIELRETVKKLISQYKSIPFTLKE
jgi:CheY-like chemotaxis protein